ncbi:hypothetical protein BFL35_14045 [Clavibacter michiganensis]|nr:hypothetical protein BFL35_14045 [Clavibacter michiganensis]
MSRRSRSAPGAVRTPIVDLTRIGIGPHPSDPTSPPASWGGIRASAHTIVKANRAWHAIEHFPIGLGVGNLDLSRLRAVGLVVASSVYAWDEAAEDDQAALRDTAHTPYAHVLIGLLQDLGVDTPANRSEIAGIERLFELELAAARGEGDPVLVWHELSRVRSADIRLQLRIQLDLLGRDRHAVVDCLRPLLEVLEVVDDLQSVEEDRRSGSFNTYLFLRGRLGGEETQAELDRFARVRMRDFGRLAGKLGEDDHRQLAITLLRPRTPAQYAVIRRLVRLPLPLLRAMLSRVVLDPLSAPFGRFWSEPAFLEDRGRRPLAVRP